MSRTVLNNTPFYLFSFYNSKYKYRKLSIFFDNAANVPPQITLPQDNTLSGARICGISVISPSAFDLTPQINPANNLPYITMPAVDQAKFVVNFFNESDNIIQNYPVYMFTSYAFRGGFQNKAKFLATDFRFQTADSFLKKTTPLPLTGNFQALTFEFLYQE